MEDWIILAMIVMAVACSVFVLVRQKRRGKSSCGCGSCRACHCCNRDWYKKN